jgi:flavin reductase (DIM6/NTAB) family NADH-FMN oxidoreductase RutF
VIVDAATTGVRETYALMTSLVVPRPIAWISTKDRDGGTNLAPFSYFTAVGSDPPMIAVSVADKRGGAPKDTTRIVRETGVFCVNLVEEPNLEKMNATSGDHAPGVSEFAVAGLTPVPCDAIDGVRVAEARASMECRLVEMHRYGRKTTTNLIVAEVLRFHVDDAILLPGTTAIDPTKIAPVARLGGPTYATLGAVVQLARPVVGGPPSPG